MPRPELIGISMREFAKRDGCATSYVRKARETGKLKAYADGSLNPDDVGTGWRAGNRKPQPHVENLKRNNKARKNAPPVGKARMRAGETPEDAADRIVNAEGRAPYTLGEAERIKENYLALLRQLEYDQKSGAVVAIEDVQKAVAVEYATVRTRLFSLPAELAPQLAIMKNADEICSFLQKMLAEAAEGLTHDARTQREVSERK